MEFLSPSKIGALLSKYGLNTQKSLGQNFLASSAVPARMVREAGIDRSCGVLEIGPGFGILTRELSAAAGRVVALELDQRFLPVLGETLVGCDNCEVIQGDALSADLGSLAAKLAPLRPVVCANLPYYITTSVLSRLLESGLFSQICIMIQREVARRLTARPGTREYGSFTVFTRYFSDPKLLFQVPPGAFFPPPKVTSAVVSLDVGRHVRPETDETLFFRVVRAAFATRRKTLVNSLVPAFPAFPKETLARLVLSCGWAEAVRGERLSFEDFVVLTDALKKLAKDT